MKIQQRIAACIACNPRLNLQLLKIRRGLDTVNRILACASTDCPPSGQNSRARKSRFPGKFGKRPKK